MTTGVASTTSTTTLAAPVVPVQVQDNLWTPSVLIALTVALAGLFGWLGKMQWTVMNAMRDLREVQTAQGRQERRTESLERQDNGKEVRLVKLEADVQHIREGQDRIEAGQKEMRAELRDNFEQLAESIREIRSVEKK